MATTTTKQTGPQEDPWHMIRTFPVPDFDGDYCDTTVSDSGHIQMVSDTPGNEFILTNHANGTYTMMLPDGSQQDEVHGDHIEIVYNNGKVWIKGSSVVSIEGSANINVGKDAYIGINGSSVTHVKGSVDITSETSISLNAPKVNFNGQSGATFSGSEMHFPSDVIIHGDLQVQQSITAQQWITTSAAVFAAGGLLTTGSLVVGIEALAMPLPALLTNMVLINCTAFTSITDAAFTSISGGATSIVSGGATAISAGGAVSLSAAGIVSIFPDAQIGDVVSFLGHIHYGVTPGPYPTSPPFPGS